MYLAVDIGGTKTLLAVFDETGRVLEQTRLETPQNYDEFLSKIRGAYQKYGHYQFGAVAVGVPGTIDRTNWIAGSFGNLNWHDVPIKKDLENLTKLPVFINNDAKLAALYEARQLDPKFSRVLYVTVSTGIGFALVVDGVLEENYGDDGGANMKIEHQGQQVPWEHLASGKGIVKRYGQRAKEITDPQTWKTIAHDLGLGLNQVLPVTKPEVIIFGGSVGAYVDKFKDFLAAELSSGPQLVRATKPQEAVIYGCYELLKDRHAGPAS